MASSMEIFSKVADYTQGRMSLQELESWLAPRLSMHMINLESEDARLAGLIELCLAELHDGIRTERGIKARLRRATQTWDRSRSQVVFMHFPGQTSETVGGSATTVQGIILPAWLGQSSAWSSGHRVASG